jgi:ATP-dependent Clp protease adaptor protein ClpS
MANKKKTGSGSGVDLLDKQKSKNQFKPPNKYKVVYHNDDFTPTIHVMISLMSFFRHSLEEARAITMHVHEKGKGIAQTGLSKEIAETKCNKVVQWFKAQGYPLLATFEKQ